MESTLMIILLFIPAAAALLMAVLPHKHTPRVVYELIHNIGMAAVCVLGNYLIFGVDTDGHTLYAFKPWFTIDALDCVFLFLICTVGFIVSVYAIPYIRDGYKKSELNSGQFKTFYVFSSLFIFTMLIAVLTNNIIIMWVAIELTTLSTAFLVGLYMQRKPALEAAWKYIFVCISGAGFGVFGVLLVYVNAANVMPDTSMALFWSELIPYAKSFDPLLMQIAFVFILIGFGTKAGLFPMNTWLPYAHSEAPAPVSALLSGVLIKCAVLVILRFFIVGMQVQDNMDFVRIVLLVVGGLTMLIATVCMFIQRDIKRLLAFSTCENIGFIALCLGFGGPVGVIAVLPKCIFHGLTKSLMFCLSGNMTMKYGTRDLLKIKGLLTVAPITGALMCMGFLALVCMPPFATFIEEIAMFIGGVQSNLIWVVVLVGLDLTIVLAVFIKVITGSLMGEPTSEVADAEGSNEESSIQIKRGEPSKLAAVPLIVLMALIMWFGIAMPQSLSNSMSQAASILLQAETGELENVPFINDIFSSETQDGNKAQYNSDDQKSFELEGAVSKISESGNTV